MTTSTKKARTFVVTSFQGGIGKTFIASGIASELHKKTGKPVALIEFNIMRPSSILDQLDENVPVLHSFLEYYMGNWGSLSAGNLSGTFTSHQGVYYIPFCGNRRGETLEPKFNLSEHDLTDSLQHLLKIFEELEGYVVIDILFKMSPLPVFLLSRADGLLYVYTSQPPSPAFAQKFKEEASCRNSFNEKILWLRNHAEDTSDNSESRLFERECAIPLSGDLTEEDATEALDNSIQDVIKHALIMPASGMMPEEIHNPINTTPLELIEYQKALRSEVVGELDKHFGISDHELRSRVESKIDDAMQRTPPPKIKGHNSEVEVKKFLIDEILGLGPLEDFMRDEDVDEIMVNGPDRIFVEKSGRLMLTDRKFSNSDHVRTVIERILMPVGRTVNERTPYVDARLQDGSRVHAIIPPLALTGPMITIRKFSKVPISMEDLVYRFKSISPAAAEFLKLCVHLKKNIIVSGGASSGKTTLLNVLSNFILPSERVICIEDSAELKLTQVNLGRLEARQQGTEAKNQVTIRDLVRNALRMRPDRIIVGECRGPEAIDMLQAMNTGHDGSLTTLHANTPRDALARLETMVLMAGVDLPLRAIREQIASSVNFVVQNGRLADGSRRLLELVEVTGIEDNVIKTQTIFKFEKKWIGEDGHVVGELLPTGALPEFIRSIPGSFLEQHAHLFKVKSPTAKNEEAAR